MPRPRQKKKLKKRPDRKPEKKSQKPTVKSDVDAAVSRLQSLGPFDDSRLMVMQALCGAKASLTQQNQVLRLVRDNMKASYEASSWGWDDVEKAQEIFHPKSILAILYEAQRCRKRHKQKHPHQSNEAQQPFPDPAADAAALKPSKSKKKQRRPIGDALDEIDAFILEEERDRTDDVLAVDHAEPPIAMISFRFEADDGRPNVYVYELQVAQSHQGQRLGETLMLLAHRVAAEMGRTIALLTVFKANKGAVRFYNRLGYVLDLTDPAECGDPDEDYHILSRKLSMSEYPSDDKPAEEVKEAEGADDEFS